MPWKTCDTWLHAAVMAVLVCIGTVGVTTLIGGLMLVLDGYNSPHDIMAAVALGSGVIIIGGVVSLIVLVFSDKQ